MSKRRGDTIQRPVTECVKSSPELALEPRSSARIQKSRIPGRLTRWQERGDGERQIDSDVGQDHRV